MKKKKSKLGTKTKRSGKMIGIIITVIIVPLLIAIVAVEWPAIKKYLPFFPRPLIRITYQYQRQDNFMAIVLENIGDAAAGYLTAEIGARSGEFSIRSTRADFDLSVSGQGGSWTVISAKNILPQQKGAVWLILRGANVVFEPPKVKSDSRYKFVGTFNITIGPEETYEEYKRKTP